MAFLMSIADLPLTFRLRMLGSKHLLPDRKSAVAEQSRFREVALIATQEHEVFENLSSI
jgi:hypothetical protein